MGIDCYSDAFAKPLIKASCIVDWEAMGVVLSFCASLHDLEFCCELGFQMKMTQSKLRWVQLNEQRRWLLIH